MNTACEPLRECFSGQYRANTADLGPVASHLHREQQVKVDTSLHAH